MQYYRVVLSRNGSKLTGNTGSTKRKQVFFTNTVYAPESFGDKPGIQWWIKFKNMNTISIRIDHHDTKAMADRYKEIPDEFHSIEWEDIHLFRQLINLQFADLSKRTYFSFVDYEPYGENPTVKAMKEDFRAGMIRVHTTGNDSKIWGTFTNLQFRAIHDYLHCLHNLDFNHNAESKVFQIQAEFSLQKRYTKRFPALNWDTYIRILRSEIVYQSAYKEAYGEFHIDQKIILSEIKDEFDFDEF